MVEAEVVAERRERRLHRVRANLHRGRVNVRFGGEDGVAQRPPERVGVEGTGGVVGERGGVGVGLGGLLRAFE
ncbi:hypothetical protein C457_05026 [Haloferax prahovense DSM 18310]|uniref:Uncharacterized protein n=1 Tax=Haloferax prahovense (strain DSM 18310 / JCM 13924 / TL6) TaxID=1227461 RepID=M0GM35_HALPT|nr:hypothetical protein C457_05026 [Haloferax prahovense DSM 18310]